MPKKSASAKSRVVRKSAKDIPPATKSDLARLRRASSAAIDTSEIPESAGFKRLRRDADGFLPQRKSMIRDAVEVQRKRLQLSVYGLWRKARVHHPALSQAAVHEFLKGQRQLELPSIEALLAAVDLHVVRIGAVAGKRTTTRSAKPRAARKA